MRLSIKFSPAFVRGAGVFPRIRAGASLKPTWASHSQTLARCFPPHSCGGLIEAVWFFGPDRRGVLGFPPHSCGGLIEAGLLAALLELRLDVFPRIRAGASLKLFAHCFRLTTCPAFSPAFVRGPH